MSELLPYEEELAGRLADIPLPDADKAWDAMRTMLEDDDDGIVAPPPNTGCRNRGLLGLLLLLLLAGVTVGVYKMVAHDERSKAAVNVLPNNKQQAHTEVDTNSVGQTNPMTDTAGYPVMNNRMKPVARNRNGKATQSASTDRESLQGNNRAIKNRKMLATKAVKPQVATLNSSANISNKSTRLFTIGGTGASANKKGMFAIKAKGGTTEKVDVKADKATGDKNLPITPTTVDDDKANSGNSKAIFEARKGDKIETEKTPAFKNQPTISVLADTDRGKSAKGADSLPAKATLAKNKTVKRDSANNKVGDDDDKNTTNKIYFSAGVGLQQLIPIDGQKANPYNALGRKGSLADYLPSVFIRVHHNRKFLQVEFKYGAPQYTKDVAYSTKVLQYDSATHIITSSVNHVNKTYYHQLPISLHYSVLPNLSIGGGVVWNKFESAVVTQQNHTSNGIIDSVVSSKVINVKSDSAFAKTYWQFMLETQYTWRRFSIGARYAWGLTPFLSFTSPTTGQTQKERNASLNLFIRYELWRPKKK